MTLVAIALSPTGALVEGGTSLQLNAIGTYSDGSSADITESVAWSSSSSGVVISPDGVLTSGTPLAARAVITATLSGVSTSANFAVGVTLNNITKLVRALVSPIQDLENALQQLLTERSVDTAVGAQMDLLGKILGEPRNGLDDDTYRLYLRARISANFSQGTTEDLIRVASLVINDVDASITVDNQGAAAYVLRWGSTVPAAGVADVLINFLIDAEAAGVRGILETLTTDDADTFYTACDAFIDGALSIGATTIPVDDATGFPVGGGSLVLDIGDTTEETVTYTTHDDTMLYGVSALTKAHADRTNIQLSTGPGLGFTCAVDITSLTLAGVTSIPVSSTEGWPSSGSLDINGDVVPYTSTDSTHFLLPAPTAYAYALGTYVYLDGVGGCLSDARDSPLGD